MTRPGARSRRRSGRGTGRVLQDALFDAVERDPGKEAVVAPDGRVSYGTLAESVLRVAAGLRTLGLRRGDRAVIMASNSLAAATAVYAIASAGGVFVVLSPQTGVEKLMRIVRHCGAVVVIADEQITPMVLEEVAAAPTVRAVVTMASRGIGAAVPWCELLREEENAGPVATIPVDLAALIYTSGSTCEPRGVMMTHGSMVFAAGSISEYLGLGPSDRILDVLPFAFDYSLYQLLIGVSCGATLVLERSFAFPCRTLETVQKERVTIFPGVPTIFARLLAYSGRAGLELPTVRRVTNTAASLPPSFHEGLRRLFPNGLIFSMYGLTECKRVSYLEPALLDEKPTSVGTAIPGTEAFVLDDEGRLVRPGEIGTLHVRGPHLMAGYWNEPELTSRMLKEGRYPGDRVLCTHDLFTVDDDGFLYFVGRTDDIIKSGGSKVSPTEVENALHAIDGVVNAAVVGVPDIEHGEIIRAYVVLDEAAALTTADILRGLRERLEGYMVPHDVVVLDQLPETDRGKVAKASLVSSAADAGAGARVCGPDPACPPIQQPLRPRSRQAKGTRRRRSRIP